VSVFLQLNNVPSAEGCDATKFNSIIIAQYKSPSSFMSAIVGVFHQQSIHNDCYNPCMFVVGEKQSSRQGHFSPSPSQNRA